MALWACFNCIPPSRSHVRLPCYSTPAVRRVVTTRGVCVCVCVCWAGRGRAAEEAEEAPRLLFSFFPKKKGKPIVQLAWSADGSSQLIAVDSVNKVHVFMLRPESHGALLAKQQQTHKLNIVDSLFDKEDKIKPEKLLKVSTAVPARDMWCRVSLCLCLRRS